MKAQLKKYKVLFISLSILLVSSLYAFKSDTGEKFFEIAKNLDIFATLFKEVNTYYVDEISPNQMVKTGIEAMLADLDPYTNYIPEDEIEDFRTMTTGEYGGIGTLTTKKNGRAIIVMVYKGYPAHRAGLKIGDEILKIDGTAIIEKNSNDISKLLKGQTNSPITLSVRRIATNKIEDISLTREKIKINNVPYFGMVNKDVGYIKLSDFTSGAAKEVKTALVSLKESGAKKIILDVRDNPGGILTEAVNICNLFISKDLEVVTTKGKLTDLNKVYTALNPAIDTEIPMVVLTSSMSASAAEIVCGVIQDYDRGVLVGEKTFGKGLVQTTRPLSYNAQLKITTQKYYIPSGRCIQAIDYAHKNEDGSVGKFADSLKVAFKTKAGRTVYDGGGVTPDLAIEHKEKAPVTQALYSKGLIFDFGTKYTIEHPTLGNAKDFKLSEAEFQGFIKFLADKQYDYTTMVEKTIRDLEANAKTEKYYEDIQEQIKSLKVKVSHNKENDVLKFKEEIRLILEEEIASRYFLEDGVIESGFDSDPDILAALLVLNDPQKYSTYLKK